MRTLVIPDIHTKHVVAQGLIDSIPHDWVVLLGDYFDDFGDTPDANQATAEWLKQKLHDPKVVCLWGNHDISYGIPSRHTCCSGYEDAKYRAIHDTLTRADWDQLQSCHHEPEGNWLLSHAGVVRDTFANEDGTITVDGIKTKCINGLRALRNGYGSPCFGAGYSRGGSYPNGGIVWEDFSRLDPLPEFRQIVGHTCQWKEPQVRFFDKRGKANQQTHNRFRGLDREGGYVIDLDTRLHHYGIIDNGLLSVHAIS